MAVRRSMVLLKAVLISAFTSWRRLSMRPSSLVSTAWIRSSKLVSTARICPSRLALTSWICLSSLV